MSAAARTTPPAAPSTPSTDQLRMAYRQLYTPLWPRTLEAALASHAHCVAITQVARRMSRPQQEAHSMHNLPKLAAPQTPGLRELTGVLKHGRSPYSIATGANTDLTSWRGSSPKNMMAAPRARTYFDPKKAAANDLDD